MDTIIHRLTCPQCLVTTVEAERDHPMGSNPDWDELHMLLAAEIARKSEDWTATYTDAGKRMMLCPACSEGLIRSEPEPVLQDSAGRV